MASKGARESESLASGPEAESRRVEHASNYIFAVFGVSLMLLALVLPLFYSEKELGWGLTTLQVLLWAGFCVVWARQGFLLSRSGVGFDIRGSSLSKESGPKSRLEEVLLYLLAFGPLCFAYIYVTHLNTSYFGFNYVLMFVVAGFATLIFPLWAAVLYLFYQCAVWVFVGHLMWGGWLSVVDVVTMISGYFFSAMMFYIFRRERTSRSRAFALSVELDEANEKLRAFSQKVEELAATQERNRIAREIHDTIGHSLTVVNMQLETAKALLDTDKDKAARFLTKAQEVTKKGLADVRSSVASLRSSPLDGVSLPTALERLLNTSLDASVVSRFVLVDGDRSLNSSTEGALYRSAQEALTNVRKHAQASEVALELDYSRSSEVRMLVADNGIGCDEVAGGFGILGIRERIQLLDGSTSVSSSLGQGLRLSVSIPR